MDADELLELLKREKEQNVTTKDSDPYVDAYLKANAASTPDHIATEVSCCWTLQTPCVSPI